MRTAVRWLLALNLNAAPGEGDAASTRVSRTVIAAIRLATVLIFLAVVVAGLIAVL